MSEETIRELARKLKAQGIAHSDHQALEMARGMHTTGSQVKEEFEQKKDEITMVSKSNRYMDQKAKEMVENALKGDPIEIQNEFEVPGVSNDVPLEEAVEEFVQENPVSDEYVEEIIEKQQEPQGIRMEAPEEEESDVSEVIEAEGDEEEKVDLHETFKL